MSWRNLEKVIPPIRSESPTLAHAFSNYMESVRDVGCAQAVSLQTLSRDPESQTYVLFRVYLRKAQNDTQLAKLVSGIGKAEELLFQDLEALLAPRGIHLPFELQLVDTSNQNLA